MSFNQYLIESLEINPINNIEVPELIKILKDYKEKQIKIFKKASTLLPFSSSEDKTEISKKTKIDKVIEAVEKLKGLKGIPLVIKYIDILKDNNFFEDSEPFLQLRKKYGPKILDIYELHDTEAPPFIRKGIDL